MIVAEVEFSNKLFKKTTHTHDLAKFSAICINTVKMTVVMN